MKVEGAWTLIGVLKKESANGVVQKAIVAKKITNLKINMMLIATVVPLVVKNNMNVSQNTKKNLIIHIATAMGQTIQ